MDPQVSLLKTNKSFLTLSGSAVGKSILFIAMNDILDTYIKKMHTLQIQERINNYYDNFIVNKI